MLLLNLIILVKMVSLTKQAQYWTTVDSNNFKSSKSIQMENFIKYKNEEHSSNRICYNTEDNQVPIIKTVCGSRADKTKHNSISNKNCSLKGSVTTLKRLSKNLEFDPLMFFLIEGCSEVGANEFEEVALFITNSIENDYETLLLTYSWIITPFVELYSCKDFCENIILKKCTERNNLILFYFIDGVLLILIILILHIIYKVYMKKKYLSK